MKINSLHEYKDFVQRHNIPLDKIRFALGEDKGHEPRWFYIYQDRFTGEWVVAKNKSDGSTAERYRGHDEAKACQILFDKMEEEFNNRKYGEYPVSTGSGGKMRRKKNIFILMLQQALYYIVGAGIICLVYYVFFYEKPQKRPGQGYYVFQNTYDDG